MAGGNLVSILAFTVEQPRPHHPRRGQSAGTVLASAPPRPALESVGSLLEKEVRAADKQYRRLTENAADIIFRYDLVPVPRIAYVNNLLRSPRPQATPRRNTTATNPCSAGSCTTKIGS